MCFKRIYVVFASLLVWVSLLSACNEDKPSTKAKILTVNYSQFTPDSHFNGVVKPSSYQIVTSPVEGHITNVLVPYGTPVKTDQPLFILTDPQINSDYVSAVINFLENKEKLRKSENKLAGEKELFNAGILPRNQLEDDQYNYDAAHVAYMRSLFDLRQKSKLVGEAATPIQSLTLHHLKEISKAISKHFSVKVVANSHGRWMSPLIMAGQSKSDLSAVHLGQKVEKGQLLGVLVKEHAPLLIRFLVDQTKINQFKKGYKLSIVSPLFQYQVFTGHILRIGRFDAVHAQQSHSGALLFPIIGVISQMPTAIPAVALLGTEVKVTVHQPQQKQIRLPISAIKFKQKKAYVTKILANGRQQLVPVVLGHARLSDVEIRSGLSAGEKVLLHD